MRFAPLFTSLILFTASACAGAGVRADVPAAVAPGHVPQPKGFHQGAMHGYTPNEVEGGKTIDAKTLVEMIKTEHPLLLDVAEKTRKPPSMDKDMIWLPSHRSIPGAVFMEGGGKGDTDPAYASAFRTRVAALTDGNKARPIVTFCHPDCWGSWNAAKRLVGDGYTKVYWFPEGTEGWEADHGTLVVKPDAAWIEAVPKEATQ